MTRIRRSPAARLSAMPVLLGAFVLSPGHIALAAPHTSTAVSRPGAGDRTAALVMPAAPGFVPATFADRPRGVDRPLEVVRPATFIHHMDDRPAQLVTC